MSSQPGTGASQVVAASDASVLLALQPQAMRRLLWSSSVGTIIEWYDFFIFASAAALVFDRIFFPRLDPLSGVLLSLMTYAVGFCTRPLGGVLFGALGDRWGRKRALVWSLFLMGIATVGVGLVPSYDSIGIAAPLLLVSLRLVQGLAVGGEVGGALLLVAESLPPERRGFWTAWPQIGGPAGNLLAALVLAVLASTFGDSYFETTGWRIGFLASGLLIGLGLWMRKSVEESPLFRVVPTPQLKFDFSRLRPYVRKMFTVLFVKAGENALFYVFTTFFVVYLTRVLHTPRSLALKITLLGSAVEVIVIFLAGALSDKLGRRPVTAFGLLASVVFAFALFPLTASAALPNLVLAAVLGGTCHGFIVGGMSAFFIELFPTAARYTAFSASYQLASALSGAVAPIVGVALLNAYQSTLPVSCYAALMAVPAVIALVRAKETRAVDLSQVE